MGKFIPYALGLFLLGMVALSISQFNGLEPHPTEVPLRPEELFFLQRNYPDVTFPAREYAQALRQRNQDRYLRNVPAGFREIWDTRGPGNVGARVNALAADPSRPGVWYAGFSAGGLFKTTDGGQRWTPLFDGQPFMAISDIAVDPQRPATVYAATGDLNISAYPFIGDGLYRSNDGGYSWQNIGPGGLQVLSRVLVDPHNSKVLYVASMGLPFERDNLRGVYKTTDGGVSWQQVLFRSDQAGFIDLVMDPQNPQVLYAASWDRVRNNRESIVSGNNARIYKTIDGGKTWQELTGKGLPDTGNMSRIGLAISAQTSGVVYAVYANAQQSLEQIYRTTDGGNSWNSVFPNGQVPTSLRGVYAGMGWYFGKIVLNPKDDNDLFLLGVDLFRTRDGGASWAQAAPPWYTYEVHADKHDLIFTPAGELLLATDGGVYASENNGMTWQDAENIPATQFYRVAHNPHRPEWSYGGAQDNGSLGGVDRIQWERIYGGDGFQMLFHPQDSAVVYAEMQNGGIVASTNGGRQFLSFTSGIDRTERVNWDAPLVMSPHDPNTLYTGTMRVYRHDSAPTGNWQAISPDLTDGDILGGRFNTISALAVSPRKAGLLYVGTSDANCWRSTDDGQNWVNISKGQPERYITSIVPSPTDENRVYVTLSGYRDNDFTPHIFQSFDRGEHWTPLVGNLPPLAVNDLFILPGRGDSILFAATDGGVFASVNAGDSWYLLGQGLPAVPVYDLAWNPVREELIAGTYGRSVVTYPLQPLLGVATRNQDISSGAAQHWQAFPNPVREALQLYWKGSSSKNPLGQLSLLNASGQIIWQQQLTGINAETSFRIQMEWFPAGSYWLRWQPANRTGGLEILPIIKQ
ncbi:MAG: hypothetical protein H6555_08025 [Lewinellaceae bacterium]|nr:hypothetical protein [Lewinellaceae bacterium]